MCRDPLHSSSEKQKKKSKKKCYFPSQNPRSRPNRRAGSVDPTRAIRMTIKTIYIIKEKEEWKTKPVSTQFRNALDYKNYRLVQQSQECKGHISGKLASWSKRIDVQTMSAVLKSSDPFYILSFSHNFMLACDWNKIQEGAAIWLFQHLMKDPFKAAPTHRLCTSVNEDLHEEEKQTTYCQVVTYLLATYATDHVIAEAEAEITDFK